MLKNTSDKEKSIKEIIDSKDKIDAFFKEIGCEKYSSGIDTDGDSLKFKLGDGKGVKLGKRKEYIAKKNERICEGYATTPGLDWVSDSVTHEAIKKSEKQLLRKGTNTVFFNHNTDIAIGKVVMASADEVGLFISVLISKAKDVEDIWTKIKEGILSNFSIRFLAKRIEIERDVNTGMILSYKIMEMELLEVSIVGLPMNKEANVTNVIGKSMNVKKLSKGDEKMDDKEKKSLITEVVKECFEELVSPVIKEKMTAVDGKFEDLKKGITDIVAKAVSEAIASAKKAEEDKKAEDAAKKLKEDEAKKLTDKDAEIADLKKQLEDSKKAGAVAGKKKSEGADDNDEGDKQTSNGKTGNVEKHLVSLDDEKTVLFVKYAMDNPSVYNGLNVDEKNTVKGFYFGMLKAMKKI